MTRHSRRDFLKAAGLGAAAMILAKQLSAGATAGDRPNILWILSEDISPELSCYGAPAVQTPNLDKLAAEGRLRTA
jgi:anaerobic selenocysteine-containing dehydrogenase